MRTAMIRHPSGNRPARGRILQSIASVALTLSLSMLPGCGTGKSKPTASLDDMLAGQDKARQQIDDLNGSIFAMIVGIDPQPEDYRLSPGDLVTVTVLEAEELKTTGRISARGFITLPLLGQVEVKSLTESEAERKIEALYRVKYIHDPHVSILIQEQQGTRVTVLGAVRKPGTYSCPSRHRLLDVLAVAEGLSEKAGRTVHLVGKTDESEKPRAFIVDMEELIKKGRSELNLEVKGGDTVYIPEAGMVYVDGAVRKPGNYPIRERSTVQEAIVAAGGFSRTADEGNIKLARYVGEGKRQVIQLSRRDLESGASDELELKDRDVVFVETSTIQALIYGLRLDLGTGLVGLGYSPPYER